jgi:hypothetical protein
MSENTNEQNKKRRHFFITNENYVKVGQKAAEFEINKWEVIDEALTEYFKKEAKEGDR